MLLSMFCILKMYLMYVNMLSIFNSIIILARFQEPVVCLSFFENNENISLQ